MSLQYRNGSFDYVKILQKFLQRNLNLKNLTFKIFRINYFLTKIIKKQREK